MTKYARKVGGYFIDVYSVPDDFASFNALCKSLNTSDFIVVDDGVMDGAAHNGGDGSAGTYTNPVMLEETASTTSGRDLTWDEFLDVGRSVDAAAFRTVLRNMPDVVEYGRSFVSAPGIKFSDVSTSGSRVNSLISDAISLGYITSDTVTAFIAQWIEDYPLIVLS